MLEGVTLEVSGGLNRPPMPRDERMAATFAWAQEIAARLGLSLTEGGTGGGSDANFVASLGTPVLDGLGPLGDWQHHAGREHVVVSSLAPRAALLAALLTEFR
ncbi:MAG TPA: M20/M25/M40 family metallo-hydrolase [Anaerolineales bacterium]